MAGTRKDIDTAIVRVNPTLFPPGNTIQPP